MPSETANFTIPDTSTAISMTEGGQPEVVNAKATNFDSNDIKEKPEDVSTGKPDVREGDDLEAPGDGEGEAGEDETEGEQSEVLGDFNAEDPEVVAKFDAKYLDAEGDLDIDGAISKEYWANIEAGKEGLDEATYAYLKSKGIKASTIKSYEAMAKTVKDAETQSVAAHDAKLFEVAGGPDKLAEALEWGKKGGYSAEAIARFNKTTAGKDLEAKEEAVEALMAKFHRANPPAKPVLPQRDATKGQGQQKPSVKPFKDLGEAKKVRDALGDQPSNSPGWQDYNRRRAASTF